MKDNGPSLFPDLPTDGIVRHAEFSHCLVYRYTLERTWDCTLPTVVFVLLNSSVADQYVDDPTNVRGMGFARAWGCGRCVFVNLFAFRTPNPKLMMAADDPIGPDNDMHIQYWAKNADKIVLAWGANGPFKNRDKEVMELLKDYECYHLGLTKDGHPRHPLYLKATTQLEKWLWE